VQKYFLILFGTCRELKQVQDDKIALTSHFIATLPRLLHKYLLDQDKMSNLLLIPQETIDTEQLKNLTSVV
jgi:hypothetical protein